MPETPDTKPSILASRKFQANAMLAGITFVAMVLTAGLVWHHDVSGDKFVELLKWAFGQFGIQGGLFSIGQGVEDAQARRPPSAPLAVAGDMLTTNNMTSVAPPPNV